MKDIIKDTDEHPDGRYTWSKVCGKGHGTSVPSQACRPPSTSVCSAAQKLPKFHSIVNFFY